MDWWWTVSSANANWWCAPWIPRLGKVKDISAAALMEDGAPVLIVDVDELVHSLDELADLRLAHRNLGYGL